MRPAVALCALLIVSARLAGDGQQKQVSNAAYLVFMARVAPSATVTVSKPGPVVLDFPFLSLRPRGLQVEFKSNLPSYLQGTTSLSARIIRKDRNGVTQAHTPVELKPMNSPDVPIFALVARPPDGPPKGTQTFLVEDSRIALGEGDVLEIRVEAF